MITKISQGNTIYPFKLLLPTDLGCFKHLASDLQISSSPRGTSARFWMVPAFQHISQQLL